jgi:hypothetical protein
MKPSAALPRWFRQYAVVARVRLAADHGNVEPVGSPRNKLLDRSPRAQLVVLHAQVDGPWQSARVSMSINRLQRPRLVVVGYGMAGNANGRGACCAGSRPVRHYRDRRRAAPEPQPHTVETIAAGPSQRLFSIDCRVEPGNDERRNAIQIERHMV